MVKMFVIFRLKVENNLVKKMERIRTVDGYTDYV